MRVVILVVVFYGAALMLCHFAHVRGTTGCFIGWCAAILYVFAKRVELKFDKKK